MRIPLLMRNRSLWVGLGLVVVVVVITHSLVGRPGSPPAPPKSLWDRAAVEKCIDMLSRGNYAAKNDAIHLLSHVTNCLAIASTCRLDSLQLGEDAAALLGAARAFDRDRTNLVALITAEISNPGVRHDWEAKSKVFVTETVTACSNAIELVELLRREEWGNRQTVERDFNRARDCAMVLAGDCAPSLEYAPWNNIQKKRHLLEALNKAFKAKATDEALAYLKSCGDDFPISQWYVAGRFETTRGVPRPLVTASLRKELYEIGRLGEIAGTSRILKSWRFPAERRDWLDVFAATASKLDDASSMTDWLRIYEAQTQELAGKCAPGDRHAADALKDLRDLASDLEAVLGRTGVEPPAGLVGRLDNLVCSHSNDFWAEEGPGVLGAAVAALAAGQAVTNAEALLASTAATGSVDDLRGASATLADALVSFDDALGGETPDRRAFRLAAGDCAVSGALDVHSPAEMAERLGAMERLGPEFAALAAILLKSLQSADLAGVKAAYIELEQMPGGRDVPMSFARVAQAVGCKAVEKARTELEPVRPLSGWVAACTSQVAELGPVADTNVQAHVGALRALAADVEATAGLAGETDLETGIARLEAVASAHSSLWWGAQSPGVLASVVAARDSGVAALRAQEEVVTVAASGSETELESASTNFLARLRQYDESLGGGSRSRQELRLSVAARAAEEAWDKHNLAAMAARLEVMGRGLAPELADLARIMGEVHKAVSVPASLAAMAKLYDARRGGAPLALVKRIADAAGAQTVAVGKAELAKALSVEDWLSVSSNQLADIECGNKFANTAVLDYSRSLRKVAEEVAGASAAARGRDLGAGTRRLRDAADSAGATEGWPEALRPVTAAVGKGCAAQSAGERLTAAAATGPASNLEAACSGYRLCLGEFDRSLGGTTPDRTSLIVELADQAITGAWDKHDLAGLAERFDVIGRTLAPELGALAEPVRELAEAREVCAATNAFAKIERLRHGKTKSAAANRAAAAAEHVTIRLGKAELANVPSLSEWLAVCSNQLAAFRDPWLGRWTNLQAYAENLGTLAREIEPLLAAARKQQDAARDTARFAPLLNSGSSLRVEDEPWILEPLASASNAADLAVKAQEQVLNIALTGSVGSLDAAITNLYGSLRRYGERLGGPELPRQYVILGVCDRALDAAWTNWPLPEIVARLEVFDVRTASESIGQSADFLRRLEKETDFREIKRLKEEWDKRDMADLPLLRKRVAGSFGPSTLKALERKVDDGKYDELGEDIKYAQRQGLVPDESMKKQIEHMKMCVEIGVDPAQRLIWPTEFCYFEDRNKAILPPAPQDADAYSRLYKKTVEPFITFAGHLAAIQRMAGQKAEEQAHVDVYVHMRDAVLALPENTRGKPYQELARVLTEGGTAVAWIPMNPENAHDSLEKLKAISDKAGSEAARESLNPVISKTEDVLFLLETPPFDQKMADKLPKLGSRLREDMAGRPWLATVFEAMSKAVRIARLENAVPLGAYVTKVGVAIGEAERGYVYETLPALRQAYETLEESVNELLRIRAEDWDCMVENPREGALRPVINKYRDYAGRADALPTLSAYAHAQADALESYGTPQTYVIAPKINGKLIIKNTKLKHESREATVTVYLESANPRVVSDKWTGGAERVFAPSESANPRVVTSGKWTDNHDDTELTPKDVASSISLLWSYPDSIVWEFRYEVKKRLGPNTQGVYRIADYATIEQMQFHISVPLKGITICITGWPVGRDLTPPPAPKPGKPKPIDLRSQEAINQEVKDLGLEPF